MKTQEGDLLTVQDLSRLTGLSVATIYHGEGGVKDLPYLKLGGAIRYRRQDVERWLEANTRQPFNARMFRSKRA